MPTLSWDLDKYDYTLLSMLLYLLLDTNFNELRFAEDYLKFLYIAFW